MGQTTFSGPVVSPGGFIGPAFGGLVPFTGTYYYVNPATGADGNTGLSPAQALKTLTAALAKCSSGKNDVVFLIGNGQATGTARLTAKLEWNKDATHLVGICSPVNISQRARISHAASAPATAFTPMVEVTGDGCMFANIQIFEGFAESTAVVAWEDKGERNYYSNVHFAGMGNATYSADETGSACLLLTGGGEHLFESCTFGVDSVPRTVANANVRLRSETARNTFNGCLFPSENEAITPWWGRFGGINDRFAVLGFGAVKEYFTTYSKVERLIQMGAPLHPETLVAESMRDAGCIIRDDLKAEFSTVRKGGQMRPPEITSIDIAHASL